ncbi:hypothetical protein ABIF91_000783 [Bradyrhizobium sp. USDA 241]
MRRGIEPRIPLTSPACGRGRRAAAGEGSFLLGVLAGEDTLSPTLPRWRGRGRTAFMATCSSHHVLAKRLRRDGLKPSLGLGCLARAQFARRIDRAGRAALDLGEDVAPGLVVAGEREAVAGRDGAVADPCESGRLRCAAREQANDRASAGLALCACSGGRFWDAAAKAGVANDVDILDELRLERDRIDRAPAGRIRNARDPRNAARARWDDVGDVRGVVAEFGDDGPGRGID